MFSRNEFNEHSEPPKRRVHYAWTQLEEYQPDGGMWSIPMASARPRLIEAAQGLMAIPAEFADAMRGALTDWPRSTSVAMTTPGLNRRAWLGHAGCYLATGSPEETTRLGWHALDSAEQYGANAAADQVIAEWIESRVGTVQPALFGEI